MKQVGEVVEQIGKIILLCLQVQLSCKYLNMLARLNFAILNFNVKLQFLSE